MSKLSCGSLFASDGSFNAQRVSASCRLGEGGGWSKVELRVRCFLELKAQPVSSSLAHISSNRKQR